jgi:hypothetical protein
MATLARTTLIDAAEAKIDQYIQKKATFVGHERRRSTQWIGGRRST